MQNVIFVYEPQHCHCRIISVKWEYYQYGTITPFQTEKCYQCSQQFSIVARLPELLWFVCSPLLCYIFSFFFFLILFVSFIRFFISEEIWYLILSFNSASNIHSRFTSTSTFAYWVRSSISERIWLSLFHLTQFLHLYQLLTKRNTPFHSLPWLNLSF